MPFLGVNIDHVATLRQARYRASQGGMTPEPDPITAALLCEKAGAHSITAHLREDRRHVQLEDIQQLRRKIKTHLNLEMAVTPAMIITATALKPKEACLVPENRQEVTTEGGLDVVGHEKKIHAAVRKLQEVGISVSLFINPDPEQIEAAAQVGAPFIELHTGAYANAENASTAKAELRRHKNAFNLATKLGLKVNAGHGLHYQNLAKYLEAVPKVHTLNIGHAIISRAIFVGLEKAVKEMMAIIRAA